jgi:FecR protein
MSARPAQACRRSGVTPRRILVLVAFIAGLALPSTGGQIAAAADPAAGAWLAEEVRGTVLIRAAGEAATSWQPLAVATPIAGQSEIATGSDGVAVLDNGVDQIKMAPNSRLVLPEDQEEGLLTVIRQHLGKILFDIGPRPDRSFEVDAPYLVVLVKGTQFTVNATYMGDSVTVTEGTVEVRPAGGGNAEGTLIGAGQTASVGPGGSTIGVESSGPSTGNGSQGTGKSEPQSNLPPRRAKPPGGEGGEDGEGEGSGGGDGGGGDGGDPDPDGGGSGGGGDPGDGGGDPGDGGGDPGDGGDPDGEGNGCGDGRGRGHGGESGDW